MHDSLGQIIYVPDVACNVWNNGAESPNRCVYCYSLLALGYSFRLRSKSPTYNGDMLPTLKASFPMS